ncbi:hypothetical protein [uncultured Tenacibaculum sp.]|uniref:hypothetical protein n=1 Tax=uncultured Tenacibaculum sp. TaxID=174713 RepID=UPI002614D9E2|nr:hypothetical protein [uncultured Tenacibaculum sp.]
MKNILTLLFLICCIISSFSQVEKKSRDYGYFKSLNINAGYNYSFGNATDKDFHLLDLGVNKSVYGGRHGGGYQYGIGTEIGLNTNDFIIGPKISGTLYYQFLAFGAELISYTNFDNWTVRFVPFIGIGGEKFKLTINPHVILSNKNFKPVNSAILNFSINFSLNRKKMK